VEVVEVVAHFGVVGALLVVVVLGVALEEEEEALASGRHYLGALLVGIVGD
jgi:hypothetical protein